MGKENAEKYRENTIQTGSDNAYEINIAVLKRIYINNNNYVNII